MPPLVYVVVKRNKANLFGFSVNGGSDTDKLVTVVRPPNSEVKVLDNAALPEGAVVARIETKSVLGLTHMDVIELIGACGETLKLGLLVGLPARLLTVSTLLAEPDSAAASVRALRDETRANLYTITLPVTTRAPHAHEADGREYRFVSVAEFERLVATKSLFEYARRANGDYYGTLRVDAVVNGVEQPQIHRPVAAAPVPAPLTAPLNVPAAAAANAAAGKNPAAALTVDDILHDDALPAATRARTLASLIANSSTAGGPTSNGTNSDDAALLERVKAAVYAVSRPVTTRPKRPGEVDGREYTFVTSSVFAAWVAEGRFLESGKHANGHHYGTLLPTLQQLAQLRPAVPEQQAPHDFTWNATGTAAVCRACGVAPAADKDGKAAQPCPKFNATAPRRFVVTIAKAAADAPLGLNLAAGRPDGVADSGKNTAVPVFVHSVTAGSAAAVDGRVHSGDQLVAVGAREVSALPVPDIATLIKAAGASVTLTFVRDTQLVAAIALQRLATNVKQ